MSPLPVRIGDQSIYHRVNRYHRFQIQSLLHKNAVKIRITHTIGQDHASELCAVRNRRIMSFVDRTFGKLFESDAGFRYAAPVIDMKVTIKEAKILSNNRHLIH